MAKLTLHENAVIQVRRGSHARGVVHVKRGQGLLGDCKISVTMQALTDPPQDDGEKNVTIEMRRNVCAEMVDAAPQWFHSMQLKLCGKVIQDDNGLQCNGEVEIEITGNVFIKFYK